MKISGDFIIYKIGFSQTKKRVSPSSENACENAGSHSPFIIMIKIILHTLFTMLRHLDNPLSSCSGIDTLHLSSFYSLT